jgi:hypothetical protein
MAAMINEGANVVHQRIALRPLDVDVTFLYGYGFARHRGGRCNTPTPFVLRRCPPTSASSPTSTRCSGKRRR